MVRPAVILVLAVTLLALGCPSVEAPPQAPPQPAAGPAPVAWRMSKSGLGFRLSDADARDDRPPPRPRTTPLPDADAARVLSRLPPLPAAPTATGFALRDRSQPPPRAGKTVTSTFPPPPVAAPAPSVSSGEPLRVTRRAPVGAIDLAPSLSVSFSAPMVPVGAISDAALSPPPVKLTPLPPGRWRWAGSQTAIFEPEKRFPMATELTVEVPAGTRAAGGQTLAVAERWTFSTPPPKVVESWPRGPSVGLSPVIFVELDQAVDERALVGWAQLTGGTKPVAVRAATEQEIQDDPVVRRFADRAPAGRWIAFKAQAPLVPGTAYVVRLPAGLPSAEGARRTAKDQVFGFSTYDPLRLLRLFCGHEACPPGAAWRVTFDNALDTRKFDRAWVRVSPEPEALKVSADGREIEIHPASRGKTRYTVTVSGALADVFGQTLGKDATVSVDVDPASPHLFAEERPMSVLDPGGAPALPVFSVNRPVLDVRLYTVGPGDWPAYLAWRRAWDEDGKNGPPPGKPARAFQVKPAAAPDALAMTPIDLGPALREGVGQVLVVVEPAGGTRRGRRQWVRTWVQVTRLGVETFVDRASVTAWITGLAGGAPIADVEVQTAAATARSGPDGLARVSRPPDDKAWGLMLVAHKGPDVALLPAGYQDGSLRAVTGDEVAWLLFGDRGVYKPGDELRVKGWVRVVGRGKGGDIRALPPAPGRTVRWSIRDAMMAELGKGQSPVDASGGFDLSATLRSTPGLGSAFVDLTLEGLPPGLRGGSAMHHFDLQEFRRPEFEVSARAGEGPHLVGGRTDVTVEASYYAGGGLPGAEARWSVTRSDAQFVPPNRAAFTFGKGADRWWTDRGRQRSEDVETWKGRTGGSGEHRLRVDFDALDPPFPTSLAFEATVTDVNRQEWTARTSLLVHPAAVYVGLRQDRSFVKAGDTLGVDVLVTDLDGAAVAGRSVTVKSARIDWEYRDGEPVEIEADPDTCAVTSGPEPVRCSLRTVEGGSYRVTATVTDAQGRRNRSETHVRVMGAASRPDATLEAGEAEVLATKPSYQAGETAELLVTSPFWPAEGALAVEREGVVHVQRFRLDQAAGTVRFPVDASWVPNVMVQVVLAGSAAREDAHGRPDPALPPRPARAHGWVALHVPPVEHRLDVTVKPREAKLAPGASTFVDLEVRDARGAPVADGVATVMVVDEAVLALTEYPTPDALGSFYFDRPDRAYEGGLREHVLVARPEDRHLEARGGNKHAKNGHATSNGADVTTPDVTANPFPGRTRRVITLSEITIQGPPEINMRKDLNAEALFAPAVATDAQGRAAVPLKLPDSVTRYRVMAVAVAGERRFGAGESSLTARLPLTVRPSAPRFLNYGDRFELPVVVQNQTGAPLEVDVAARAENAQITEGAGRRVTVPAGDRVEVRLPAAAAAPGKARFQIGAVAGALADAAEVELPVWTPATAEAFATYGTLDEGAVAQPVKAPTGVEPSFGGLEITTSSTAVSALADAVLYLTRYPFECNEQIASRVLAVAALRDVLGAFGGSVPPSTEIAASLARDIDRLRDRQHASGGWAFWPGDPEPWPYLSVHVAFALARAREKGHGVPAHTLSQAKAYLRAVERHLPASYSAAARQAIVAYALFVRRRLGDADPARARKLVAEAGGAERLPIEAAGWILPTLAEDPRSIGELRALRRAVQNRVTETAGAAHFASPYEDGAHVLLASERRADGILLEALIGDQPSNDLIPKLVAGLLSQRRAGHWASTQENAFVLLALDRYFSTYEKATPDFVARAWLGDRFAGEHAFKGRTTERHQVDIPMRALADAGSADLVLAKDGPGRAYYRVGMTYVPEGLRTPSAEHGLAVSRVYEAVDEPGDVRRDADGTWHVKAGARVRVRLSLVAPARRYHVALVDPLPAGFEVMNPALAVTGSVPLDPKAAETGEPWWWSRPWYEHQNLRDERVEAFTSQLWEGVYAYDYVARATTPGTFVAPPPKAEEMYSPETFGRGAGERVVVE